MKYIFFSDEMLFICVIQHILTIKTGLWNEIKIHRLSKIQILDLVVGLREYLDHLSRGCEKHKNKSQKNYFKREFRISHTPANPTQFGL
jgi:hypothetical protein